MSVGQFVPDKWNKKKWQSKHCCKTRPQTVCLCFYHCVNYYSSCFPHYSRASLFTWFSVICQVNHSSLRVLWHSVRWLNKHSCYVLQCFQALFLQAFWIFLEFLIKMQQHSSLIFCPVPDHYFREFIFGFFCIAGVA